MLINKQKPRNKQPNKDRLHLNFFWLAGWYLVPEEFKERMRINRETFDFILEWIAQLIHKDPTYIASNPIQDHRQLGLTIYRLTHGCLFKVIMEIFGFPHYLTTETFNNVIQCMVLTLYDEFICLQRTEADWANECKGFIKNNEFPCVEA